MPDTLIGVYMYTYLRKKRGKGKTNIKLNENLKLKMLYVRFFDKAIQLLLRYDNQKKNGITVS